MGRGDPGWGSRPALGEALVPRGPDGRHHRALPVSPQGTHSWAHSWHSTHFLLFSCETWPQQRRGPCELTVLIFKWKRSGPSVLLQHKTRGKKLGSLY